MPDVNDLHRFYENNLPGYLRRDLVSVTKFFIKEMGLPSKKPIKQAILSFGELKNFVVFDWQGFDEIRTKRLPPEAVTVPSKKRNKRDDYGKCGCGGFMVKRQNRSDKSYFFGCSSYPKCKNTKPLLD